jgi:hypothetical protein
MDRESEAKNKEFMTIVQRVNIQMAMIQMKVLKNRNLQKTNLFMKMKQRQNNLINIIIMSKETNSSQLIKEVLLVETPLNGENFKGVKATAVNKDKINRTVNSKKFLLTYL